MLVSIGKRRTSGELGDLLLECHGRIRQFLSLARDAAERGDLSAEDVSDGCHRVQRYFSEALPLHVKDEEESVLPRLLGRSDELDRALALMQREHHEHERLLGELLTASSRLRDAPSDSQARLALGTSTEALARVFEPHLAEEEATIFPAVRQLLSASEQAAIVRELRARRDV